MKNIGSWVRWGILMICFFCLVSDVKNHARYAGLSYSQATCNREETRDELRRLEYQVQELRAEIRQVSKQNR